MRRWLLVLTLGLPSLRCADAPAAVSDESDSALSGADTAAADSQSGDVGELPEPAVLEPASSRVFRLTSRQYRNAVRDLFGATIVPPAVLEPDMSQDALIAIGATITSVSPRGVEQYFDAALSIAHQVVLDPAAKARVLPCTPKNATDADCAREAISTTGRRIWRRPLSTVEVDGILAHFKAASAALGTFDAGLEYSLVALLSAPQFLYRMERGESDPTQSGRSRYTSYDMAARLAFFLWNSTPDDALLAEAEGGVLVTDAGVRAAVTRMLADPRARDGVRNFFAEWLDLYLLDQLGKDPTVFKHFSADLGPAAREETLRLIEDWVFDRDADYRELYTTRATFVSRRLAAIYDVPAPADEGFAPIELPIEGIRRGLLGHVSFLAQQSHPTSSSATLRGKFVRQRLICGYVPPPPVNLNTAIPEASATAKTLKERLVVHMKAIECNGCHSRTDPVGFGLEHFDGIGRLRSVDNGAVIDPSGQLDDYSFKDSLELAEVVANHPDLIPCVVKMVYSYAGGHLPEAGETGEVTGLTASFQSGGNRIRGLFESIANSPGFRSVAPPSAGGVQ